MSEISPIAVREALKRIRLAFETIPSNQYCQIALGEVRKWDLSKRNQKFIDSCKDLPDATVIVLNGRYKGSMGVLVDDENRILRFR